MAPQCSPLTLFPDQNPSSYCDPFTRDQNGLPIAPCGAVANSIFNGKHHTPSVTTSTSTFLSLASWHASFLPDSFTLTYHRSGYRPVPVPLLRKGITWYTDKNVKYRNPAIVNQTLAQVFEGKFGCNLNQTQNQCFTMFMLTQISFMSVVSGLRLLHRHSTASVLAEACVRARSLRPEQQRLHQWRPDHLDERGGLPQLQEALWCFIPSQQALYQRSASRKLQHRDILQYPFTAIRDVFHGNFGMGQRRLHVSHCVHLFPLSYLLSTVKHKHMVRDYFKTIFHWASICDHLFPALTSAFPDFPVQYFRGRKKVVLTTLTWFGGQNHFLPIAYLVTSSLILLIAVVLTVVWWKFGKDGKNMEAWKVKTLRWWKTHKQLKSDNCRAAWEPFLRDKQIWNDKNIDASKWGLRRMV